jgi:hypothetical protein
MSSLRSWSKEKFGAVTSELLKIRRRMEVLNEQEPSETENELRCLRERMDGLLYQEEMMWLQRSQIAWLKEGDRNTKKNHRKATSRAKKNKVKWLRKENEPSLVT